MPVLMMSGSDDGEAGSLDAGADSFLQKPFRAADLVRSVADLLRSTGGIARPVVVVS
jgi:DNA-binding response OmpR family regulator